MNRRHALPIAALVLLGLGHAAPALLTGQTFARNDYGAEVIPAFASLRGHLPFFGAPSWNPTIFGGAPAEVLPVMARYPPTAVAYVLSPMVAVPLFVGAHLALAAFAAWAFIRRVAETSSTAAVFGAIVYAFGGALWLRGMHVQNLAVAAWTPLILLAIWEVSAAGTVRGRREWCAALGAALGAALLVGGGLQVLFMAGIAGLFVLGDGLASRLSDGIGRRRALVDALPWLAPAVLLGLLLGAPGLVPFLETLAGSARGGLTLTESGAYSLDPGSVVRLLAPDLRLGARAWSWPSYVERWFYFGILTLPLVGIGARDPRGKSILLLALAAVVLALGLFGPLHYVLYYVLPGYDHLRAHGRWVILAGLAVGAVAARGLDHAIAVRDARRPAAAWAIALASVAALALIARRIGGGPFGDPQARDAMIVLAMHGLLAGAWMLGASLVAGDPSRPRRIAGAAACVLLAVDVCGVVFRIPLETPRGSLTAPAVFRTAASKLDEDARISHDDAAGPRPLNSGGRWGYRNARGYSQAVPEDYSEFLALGAGGAGTRYTGLPEREDRRLLHLLGVGMWVGSEERAPPAGFSSHPVARAQGLAAWPSNEPPFQAAVVGSALVVPDVKAARAASLAIDPDAIAVVEADVGLPSPGSLPPGPAGKVLVERPGTDDVILRVHADRESLVVLGESHHPRWRAWVDGEPATIVRADAVWQAVRVGPGPHEIRFRARSAAPWWSWLSALAGFSAIAALARAAGMREP